MFPRKWIACACLPLLLAGGCAGYRLGPTNGVPAGQRSVRVAYFQNTTPQPRVSEAIDVSLRRALQQDGTYRLATGETGDIVISGTVIRYERPALSFQSSDTRVLQDYKLRLVARIQATDRSTGQVLFDREVTGSTVVRAGSDQSGVERQALPLAADDLARRATGLLVDGEW